MAGWVAGLDELYSQSGPIGPNVAKNLLEKCNTLQFTISWHLGMLEGRRHIDQTYMELLATSLYLELGNWTKLFCQSSHV